MKFYPCLVALVAVMLGGCATVVTRDAVSAAGKTKTVVVTAFEPAMQAGNIGTTVFQNNGGAWKNTGFDTNAVAVDSVRGALTRDVKTINGAEVGLARLQDPDKDLDEELTPRLVKLGSEWDVDLILVLTTESAMDWFAGTKQRLSGIGYFRREFLGSKRRFAYGVFVMKVFDCRVGKFVGKERMRTARKVPEVNWHEQWGEYSAVEKRTLLRAWGDMVKQGVPGLLTKAGLAKATVEEGPDVAEYLTVLDRPQPVMPEGNVLPIPSNVSKTRAHAAVIYALKRRGWAVLSETDEKITGVYRDGKKEAGMSALITDREITLAYEAHRVETDGTRKVTDAYERWNNNLKASIFQDLNKAVDEVLDNTEVSP